MCTAPLENQITKETAKACYPDLSSSIDLMGLTQQKHKFPGCPLCALYYQLVLQQQDTLIQPCSELRNTAVEVRILLLIQETLKYSSDDSLCVSSNGIKASYFVVENVHVLNFQLRVKTLSQSSHF